MTDTYLVNRIQKYSSYAFTVFALTHITNTSILPLTTSLPKANDLLLLTRPYYQALPIEVLFIGLPLAAHVSSGLALRIYRRQQNLKRYGAESRRDHRFIVGAGWPAVSGTSVLGFASAWLVAGHVFTTRVLPMYQHGDNSLINLSYISHGIALHPLLGFAGFTTLIAVAVSHMSWGMARWWALSPAQVVEGGGEGHMRRKRRWYGINAVAATVASLWLAGGLGIVGRGGKIEGWVGREYDDLYRHIPLLGSMF